MLNQSYQGLIRTFGRYCGGSARVLGAVVAFVLIGLMALPGAVAEPGPARGNGQPDERRSWQEQRQSREARGRFGGGGGGGGGEQWWRTRERLAEDEILMMASALALDDGQISIISALFSSFDEAYQAEVAAAQEQLAEMREEVRAAGDWTSIMRRSVQLGVESQRRAAALEQAFLSDIRASVLTTSQQERWSSYQREQRRRSTLRRGARLPGEGVDLFEVVAELELPAQQAERLAATLTEYALELDDALVARNYYVTNVMANLDAVMAGESNQDANAVYRKGNEKRQAIRRININYAELLAGQLDTVTGERIRDAFNRAAYPRVYRVTDFEKYAEKMLAVETLTLAQRELLSGIEADYRIRVRDINRQLAVLDIRVEEERQQRMLAGFQMMYTQEDEQDRQAARERMRQMFRARMQQRNADSSTDPAELLRQEKNDLETAALDACAAVLTPEQLEAAPRPQPEAERAERRAAREKRRAEWRQRLEEGGGRGGGRDQ